MVRLLLGLLVEKQSSDPHWLILLRSSKELPPSQSINSLLNGDETLSARERNKAKRKAKQLSRQNSLSGPRFYYLTPNISFENN